MHVHTATVFDISSGGRWIALFDDSFLYSGPVAWQKKGRETQAAVSQADLDLAKKEQATREAQLQQEQPIIDDLQKKDAKGLSQAASSQFGQDLANINQTYSNARNNGLRSIYQRGLGNAPTGAESSLLSTADMSQARDENAAFNTAQQVTHQDELNAANILNGLQTIYNPNQSYSNASQSALAQSQQGSLLGDIGGGLTTIGSLVSAKVPGGVTLGSCHVAAELFSGWGDPRTSLVRDWLFGPFAQTRVGSLLSSLYRRHSEKMAEFVSCSPLLRRLFRHLFNAALRRAVRSYGL